LRTAVSLFAGVGGFDLALERAGVKVVASVEIDKKAQDVLRRHFPNSTIFGDISGVTGEQLIQAGFNARGGIITGGFPCQDLSVAGKRAGLAGKRSGLFWEICRLIDETGSETIILENVPGLLSSNNGRDMAVVIEALVKRGYRVGWRVLDAQHFGVPQRRRRVFIVGCLRDSRRTPEEILNISQSRAGYLEASQSKRKDSARKVASGVGDSSRAGNFELYDFPSESVAPTLNALRARDTMTYRMQSFGQYEEDETASALKARVGDVRVYEDQVMQTVIKRWGTGGGNVPMIFEDEEPTTIAFDTQFGSNANTFENVSPTLKASQQPPSFIEVEPIVMRDREGCAGGGKGPLLSDKAFTLASSNFHTLFPNSATVRRLTPTECERLQGFPDGWTGEQADSNRYKQMGNAVAVPVVQWIINNVVGDE
jgi:DNA (cytosine-5)-methyltransferase 1